MAGSSVIIKSYNKGLAIHLDAEADMETIKTDLADRFREAAGFFKDAKMAVSFEDRELDSMTERELVNIILANSQVQITCIAGKNKLTQALLTNALNQVEFKSEVESDAVRIYRGSLKDGRLMDVPGSILILGDVYPGCSVIATGDIFIYGGLFGQAHAGNSGEENHIVAALDMNPEKLRIAGIKYKSPEKSRWLIKNKQTPVPKAAYLSDGVVCMEPVDKQFWSRFYD